MTIRAVRVRGSFRGPTGHDHHVRSFTRELARAGVDVELIDMPEWSARRLPPEMQDPWFETLNRDVSASVYLQFCMPHQVRSAQGLRTVNYTMFEADRIPKQWKRVAMRSTLTVLPEASSRDAWLAAGVPAERLRICPLGIDPALFSTRCEPIRLIGNSGENLGTRRVRMLNLSEIVPRKNQRGLLLAWLIATSASDDAVLVIKPGGATGIDDHRLPELMRTLEHQTGRAFAEAAPVHLLMDNYGDAEMPRLYAAATHYISMSFGEGWDLPMMEAAASGLRLIAPDHTAYRSYLNHDTATLLPTRLVPAEVSADFRVLFANAQWWEPDQKAAIQAIRNAIDDRESTVASARDFILGHYTWERAAARLIEILTEAETQDLPTE